MPSDEATVESRGQRIVQHLNRDHKDSLSRYLEFFSRVPAATAQDAHLEEVTLEHMIIASAGTRYLVRFEPPLQDWSEARARTVEMDRQALKGLGRSQITITEYALPRGSGAAVFALVVASWILFSRPKNFLPGSWYHDYVLVRAPAFGRFQRWAQPYVLWFMIIVHAGELLYFERSRLQKHGVKRFTGLWWKWVVSVYVEGFGSFLRFDAMVRRASKTKEH